MKLHHGVALCAICVAASALSAISTETPERRVIRLSVSVASSSGAPVEGLCVGVLTGEPSSWDRTDANWMAVLTADVPSTSTSVWVGVVPSIEAYAGPQSRTDRGVYDAATTSSVFQRFYEVTLAEGVNQYQLPIVGSAARSVSVRLVKNGQPIRFNAMHPFTISPIECDGGGSPLKIGGLPCDDETLIFLYTRSEQIYVLSCASASAGSETPFGDLEVGPDEPGRKVSLRVDQNSALCRTLSQPITRCKNLTIVRVSDGKVFGCGVSHGSDTSVVSGRPSQPMLQLPIGSYFVCPGLGDGSGLPTKLLRLVQDGRIPDLMAAGVPMLNVDASSGEVLMYSIDGPAIEFAIHAIQ
jgi:hypothetical protein